MSRLRKAAPVPPLAEWKTFSDEERRNYIDSWNPYSADGESLFKEIEREFRDDYGHRNGLAIQGIGNCHGSLVIGATHRLIFDRRLLPGTYLGLPVHCSVSDIPADFQVFKDYIWAPENYQHFVDRHAEEIRRELGRPEMSPEEMLHALCGMPFPKWIEVCRGFGKGYTAL
jgi:hypothetical protein